jgi:acylphosphatase
MTICVKCLISGKVQGVFFRASTREQALSLGVSGYARNLADGRVEVMACGEKDAVDRLRGWLTRGPAGARVTAIACETQENLSYQSFSVQ